MKASLVSSRNDAQPDVSRKFRQTERLLQTGTAKRTKPVLVRTMSWPSSDSLGLTVMQLEQLLDDLIGPICKPESQDNPDYGVGQSCCQPDVTFGFALLWIVLIVDEDDLNPSNSIA